jgi:hypothetical protein
MAQISLYIDSKTLEKVESAAQSSKMSISKYISTTLEDHLNARWPPDYAALLGSVDDKTFFPNEAESYRFTSAREKL